MAIFFTRLDGLGEWMGYPRGQRGLLVLSLPLPLLLMIVDGFAGWMSGMWRSVNRLSGRGDGLI